MRSYAPSIALIAALAWVYRHLFLGELFAGRDVLRLAYPDSHFLLECLRRGEWPLWNPHVFLGQPFLATLQAQALYPPRILFALGFGPYWGVSLLQVFHAGVAAVGVFVAARALGRSRLGSGLGGAAFGLSPLFTELSGTPNLVSAAAWSGFIVAAALRARTSGQGARLAGFFALALLAGSPETVLWQGLVAVAVVGVSSRAVGRVKAVAWVGGAGLWGAALAAAALLPAFELAAHSSRAQGKGSHLDWSASWPQIAALVWPNADQPRGAYWGDDQWLLLQLFVGTSVGVLAVVAMFRPRRRIVALVVVAALLSLLALGRHFGPSEWLLSLPGIRAFRYPGKALIGVAFCLALLSAFGFDRLRAMARTAAPGARRALLGWVGILAGMFAITAVLRAVDARAGAIQGGLWVGIVAASLWGVTAGWRGRSAAPAGSRRARTVGVAVIVIAGIEWVVFHGAFVGTALARAEALKTPSGLAALAQGGRISVDYRPPRDAAESAGPIEVPRGIDPTAEASRQFAVPNRFVEDGLFALEGYGAPEPPRIQEFHLARKREIYDLAGVTLFVRAEGKPFDDLEDVTPDPAGPGVWRSVTAAPRVFVVHRARTLETTSESLAAITEGAARDTVLLAEKAPSGLDECQGSRAEVVAAGANFLEVAVQACGRGYLVVTDAFFPGWEAQRDGQETQVLRANHVMRAVEVSGESRRVVFRYRPGSFTLGGAISLVALIAAVVFGLLRTRLSRSGTEVP